MTLTVLEAGLHTLVVDLGRPATRSLGVPVGGAADRTSLALGNALVGNAPGAAALEISLAGPAVRASGHLAAVVAGAPFDLSSDRQPLAANKTFTLQPGEVLRIGSTRLGVRAYLCVQGGLMAPTVLGSRSAFEPLQAGDELPCRPGRIGVRFVRADLPWCRPPDGPRPLRVLPGPQADWFDPASFFDQVFTVTAASNRMGLRLQGRPLVRRQGDRQLLSEPVCPGAVQVTSDGQCIILGIDGQTIGGYPKMAHVISADLDALGQLRPDESIRFVQVGLAEAECLYQRQQTELKRWLSRLRLG